jgi:hypothetical protein
MSHTPGAVLLRRADERPRAPFLAPGAPVGDIPADVAGAAPSLVVAALDAGAELRSGRPGL